MSLQRLIIVKKRTGSQKPRQINCFKISDDTINVEMK